MIQLYAVINDHGTNYPAKALFYDRGTNDQAYRPSLMIVDQTIPVEALGNGREINGFKNEERVHFQS